MKLTVLDGPEELAALAAEEILGTVARKPDAILILPTGNTPLPTYARVAKLSRERGVDWSRVRVVSLDEYSGIDREDPRVLGAWLERRFTSQVGIDAEHFIRFDPAGEPQRECARIEAWLADHGPADLAILGLGLNGHLGFNEPGTPFASRAHHLALTPESIASNAVYWGGAQNVPRWAFTLGLGTLTEARRIMLLVSGASKAGIMARSVDGPVGSEVPATALRRRADTIVLADRDAAAAVAEGRMS